jgi:hypothetical protein
MALNTLPNAGLTSKGYPSDRIVTPIIINGDMSVAQRSTSASSSGSGYHCIDRMNIFCGIGTHTFSQSTTVPTGQGFAKSFKVDCTTAEASPGASDVFIFGQKLEGQNLQSLKKGTSSSESTTFSFWVRSNKTGTYTCEIQDLDNTRQISKTYTINSADTWEKKVISFAGDTTGAFDNDNANSCQINWWIGAGSNFTSGTLNTSWASTTNANRVSSSQVNIGDSTSNEWYITGLQWEVGEFDSTSIPSFPFESFDNNFQRCERYFQFIQGFQGQMAATTNFTAVTTFRTPMRSAPSATVFGTGVLVITDNTSDFSQSSASGAILAGRVTTYGVQCYYPNFSGLTIFRPAHQNVNVNDFKMGMDAEL